MKAYRARPDIRPMPKHYDYGEGRIHFTPGSIKSQNLYNRGITDHGYYSSSKYNYCIYGTTGFSGTLNFAVYA